MYLKSFSKLNLSLKINKKLKNKKLHEIQSYYCLINLFDEIKVKKISGSKDVVKFIGKFTRNIDLNNNSVLTVLRILRNEDIIKNYYSVIINKKIPIFSGLGGGTGNAFFLARHFVKNRLNKKLINIFNDKIGTDFRLFSFKQGFLKNLNNVKKMNKIHKMYFLLIYPYIRCSTKEIYSKVENFSSKFQHNPKKTNIKKNFFKLLCNQKNDLQNIVERKYPIIQKIIFDISRQDGCQFSRITGSGSVCFGVFSSDKTAKSAYKKLKLKYPKYWMTLAKTI